MDIEKFKKDKKRFQTIIARFNEKGFPFLNIELSKKIKSLYEEHCNDYSRFFYDNVKEKYRPLIVLNMFASLGNSVSDMIAFKVGRINYDTRIHYIIALITGGGKKSFEDATTICARAIGKEVGKSGSEHEEAFIGSVETNELDLSLKKNREKGEKISNVVEIDGNYYVVNKTKGIFDMPIWINSEAGLLIDIEKRNKSSKFYKYLCDALEPLPKSEIFKSITKSKFNLKYITDIVIHCYIQNQMINPEYYTAGPYRRAPILTAEELKLNEIEEIEDDHIDDEEILHPKFFLESLKDMRKYAKGIQFEKSNFPISNEPTPYSYTKGKGDKKEIELILFPPYVENDFWLETKYSNVKFTSSAINMVGFYLNHFYEKLFQDYRIYITEFKKYSKKTLKNFFYKFAFLLMLLSETNKKQEVKEIVVDEDIIHIVAKDVESIFNSMFAHFRSNYSIKYSLKLSFWEEKIVKQLRNGYEKEDGTKIEYTSPDTMIATTTLKEFFKKTYDCQKSTFHKSLSNLIDRGIVIQVKKKYPNRKISSGDKLGYMSYIYLDLDKIA